MIIALTRAVAPAIGRCELTYRSREAIDVGCAERQHLAYERALERAGCRVERVRPEPELPDGVFVEDTAVVLDEVAILTRPGAAGRRAETPSVADALASRRRLFAIEAPGTIDGGDVLRIGRSLWVGVGGRTNAEGFEQFRAWLSPLGYEVHAAVATNCLHLKSAVTCVADGTVLVHPGWVDCRSLAGLRCIEVDPGEPSAANALLVNGTLLCAEAYPRTRARLEAHGIEVSPVDMSELAKAEGALTCCCLIIEV